MKSFPTCSLRAHAAWVAALSVSQAVAGSLFAATPYRLTSLGDLPGGRDESQAFGINNYGQVSGESYGPSSFGPRAFLWTPTIANGTIGSMVDLPAGNNSGGSAINGSGQVTGFNGTLGRPFLWTPGTANATSGLTTDLGHPPGTNTLSYAWGINNSGQVVGYNLTSSGFGNAQLWTPSAPNGSSGSWVNLGNLPGGSDYAAAWGINAWGQVVGTSGASGGNHAFLWTPATPNGTTGSMVDLGHMPGGEDFSHQARAINGSGQIAGVIGTPAGNRAFFWTPNTPMAQPGR